MQSPLSGRILITGGSGFLGRGLLRRNQRYGNAAITVLSRDEHKQSLCRQVYRDARYVLGDVRDTRSLMNLMRGFDTVIHAAALKFVPEGEANVSECIAVNIGGTDDVLHCARWSETVSKVIFISTDKAVAPANVYGMTKALGERLVGEKSQFPTPFVASVRYGNVVGSTGSVVPRLMEQARNGQITITDPNMTRFWLGVDDAINLILMALGGAFESGSTFVPRPKAMRLDTLVETIASDASLVVAGLRPGEKMHETLLTEDESMWANEYYEGTLYEVLPHRARTMPVQGEPFSITSDTAEEMTPDEFLALVEDAAHV